MAVYNLKQPYESQITMRKKIEHTGPETGRLAFLDYLRIIAFVSVLVGHEFYKSVTGLIQNEQAHATFRMFARLLEPLVFGGGTGVVLFFMVSGYVNTHVLQKEQSVVFLSRGSSEYILSSLLLSCCSMGWICITASSETSSSC